MTPANLVHLGRMDYQKAWDLQRQVGASVASGALSDTVLLVEHLPVYTVGRAAHGSLSNLLWDEERRHQEGIDLVSVDRGGDITYHGPGQLVGYPILDLKRHGSDLNQYLRRLEAAIIAVLARFDIAGYQDPPHTGVWVGDEKVAAIGVKASQWITQHGFALNVDPDLTHFTGIVPCGIQDKGVTSMARILGHGVALEDVTAVVEVELAQEFAFAWTPLSADSLIYA